MKISIRDSFDGQKKVINENGNLCGLITKETDGQWRVEMFMQYDVKQSNYDRAIGFAYGVAAATN